MDSTTLAVSRLFAPFLAVTVVGSGGWVHSTTLEVSLLLAPFLAVTVALVCGRLARSLIASKHSTHTVRPQNKSVHCWHAGYEHSLQCEKSAERLRFSQTRHNSRTGVLFSFPASSLGSVSLLSGLASGLSLAVRRGGSSGSTSAPCGGRMYAPDGAAVNIEPDICSLYRVSSSSK